MKKLLIIGAGGYGQTIYDVAEQLGIYEEISFLDDKKTGPNILGGCGEYQRFLAEDTEVYPAFGNNALRHQWVRRLLEEGARVPTIVHPSAYVSPRAKLGTGTVVLPLAVVNTGTVVEEACLLNLGCIVDHDCVIEAGVHLCPGVVVKPENRIAALRKLEPGEIILSRVYPTKE